MELMDWSDAEQLLRLGHEIGCHTATHPMMIDLPESQLAQEIAQSLDELSRRLGAVQHFAFPFGRFETLTPAALAAARSCHVLSCASAEPGCHVAKTSDPLGLCIRRLVIDPDLPLRDIRYLLARLSKRATAADNDWPWH